jgi:hypothetical protein
MTEMGFNGLNECSQKEERDVCGGRASTPNGESDTLQRVNLL